MLYYSSHCLRRLAKSTFCSAGRAEMPVSCMKSRSLPEEAASRPTCKPFWRSHASTAASATTSAEHVEDIATLPGALGPGNLAAPVCPLTQSKLALLVYHRNH